MPDDTMSELARQDLYPDERYMQPPVNPVDLPPEAYASLGGGDLGLLGKQGLAGLFNRPSWLQKAQDVGAKDVASYQTGSVPAVLGDLAADSSEAQDLAGGFGGNIKSVKPPVVPGALAAISEYHPPFYSAVEKAVQDAKQNVAPGQQWAGYLRNQPGVKPEEVEALGLGKLFEQPGAVPKKAVLGEIAANKVNVGEVVKGVPYDTANITVKRVGDGPNAYWESFDGDGNMIVRHPGSMSEAQALSDAQRFAEIGPQSSTKFSQYTLPGGENYREMLLTLPGEPPPQAAIARASDLQRQTADAMADWKRLAEENTPGHPDTLAAYQRVADVRRERDAAVAEATKLDQQYRQGQFKSSHFDEPNVLAHVRYNDRVIDGKKTLFVEEVQSDWHQKGKREGYKTEQPQFWVRNTRSGNASPFFDTMAEADAYRNNLPESVRTNTVISQRPRSTGTVPDAPFKTTWPDLAMKRVIREAAEKGYDKVAWTPGSVQAERYDLSKHVDYIDYAKEPNGNYRLGIVGKDGQGINLPKETFTPNELADYVGKDMAEKIVKGEGITGGGRTTLAGQDLKIGGEGMKGFYDEILPATVNRLVKKHGAGVGKSEPSQTPMTMDAIAQELGYGGWHTGLTKEQKAHVDSVWEANKSTPREPVHSLDITPSLRAAAMKGFPLFTAGGVAATGAMGELAKQDDYQ